MLYIYRGGGTGPADPASAGPIILAQLVNIHTNAHVKPYLPLVYSTLDGQISTSILNWFFTVLSSPK